MIKTNNNSAQKALTYCIYMMVSGNFAGCKSVTSCLEKKLLIEYRIQKEKDQAKFEDEAARLADKFFLNKLPENIWKESPKAILKVDEKTGVAEVNFVGNNWKLRVVGTIKGKNSPKFMYSFTENVKNSEKKSSKADVKDKKSRKKGTRAA